MVEKLPYHKAISCLIGEICTFLSKTVFSDLIIHKKQSTAQNDISIKEEKLNKITSNCVYTVMINRNSR